VSDSADTLVVLTASYPFGTSSETFLDAELPILARRFARVIVVPSNRDDQSRRLPAGVRCETFLADCSRQDVLRTLLRYPGSAAVQFARAVVDEGSPLIYLCHPLAYMGVIALNLFKYRLLKEFVMREGLADAVFYDYWLENSTLALSLLRRSEAIHRGVARAHGFDLYDERSRLGAVPFRAFNVSSLDRVIAISSHGFSYLETKHPDARAKLRLSRLGVERQRRPSQRNRGSLPSIVSCASLTPLKRVQFVPEVLRSTGQPLRWVHFGDGPCRAEVERAAETLPNNVSWRLAGHVDRTEVLRYYRENNVDLFVSMSSSEGLPVSIMEAVSFGIPVLATDVGGVAEIVNSHTGRLVSVHDSIDEIARIARQLLDGDRPSVEEMMEFFEANFDAEKNFNEFAELLHAV